MNNKFKYLLKNTGILVISNFSSKILVFLLVPLYTSVLSTYEYGIYDLVYSMIQLLFPVLSINIADGVMRYAMDRKWDKKEIISVAIFHLGICFFLVALFLGINKAFGIWKDILNFEALIFFYFVSYVFNQFLIQFAKGMEKIKEMGIAGALGTLSMLGFNILFLCVIKNGLPGFFMANALGQAVPAVFLGFRLRIWKYIGITLNRTLQREMLIYSFPLLFSTIGWWMNSAADKYVVTFICGVAANGLLSVAYKIPSILNTLQSIFIQAWQVSAIKEYGSKETTIFYGKAFVYLNASICMCCSILILLTRNIAHILFAKDFYTAWEYVPFLLISSVINSASGFIGPILSAKKDSKSMAKSAIYGTGINIILNIILVYLIGIQGAAIATVISSYIIYYVRKKAVEDVFVNGQYRNILISWGVLCAEAIFEICTTSYIVPSICLVVIIFIYRETMLAFCHVIKKLFLRKI